MLKICKEKKSYLIIRWHCGGLTNFLTFKREKTNTWFLCHQWMIWGLIYRGSVCHASACVIYLMVHLVKWSIKSFENASECETKRKSFTTKHTRRWGDVQTVFRAISEVHMKLTFPAQTCSRKPEWSCREQWGEGGLFSLRRQLTIGQDGLNFLLLSGDSSYWFICPHFLILPSNVDLSDCWCHW